MVLREQAPRQVHFENDNREPFGAGVETKGNDGMKARANVPAET